MGVDHRERGENLMLYIDSGTYHTGRLSQTFKKHVLHESYGRERDPRHSEQTSPRSILNCNHEVSRVKVIQISPQEPLSATYTREAPRANPMLQASMLLLIMTRTAWLSNQRTSSAPWHMPMKTRNSTFPDCNAWDLAHPTLLLEQILWAMMLSYHCLPEIEERLSLC